MQGLNKTFKIILDKIKKGQLINWISFFNPILNSPGELVRFCEFENYSFGIQFCNINSFFLSAAQKELGNQRNRLPFSCWLLIYMNFFSLQVDINSPGHNDNLSLPKVFYEYPLTICTQFLQFSRLKCPV